MCQVEGVGAGSGEEAEGLTDIPEPTGDPAPAS